MLCSVRLDCCIYDTVCPTLPGKTPIRYMQTDPPQTIDCIRCISGGAPEAVAPNPRASAKDPRFNTRTLEFCTPCGFTKGCETTMDDVCVCTTVHS